MLNTTFVFIVLNSAGQFSTNPNFFRSSSQMSHQLAFKMIFMIFASQLILCLKLKFQDKMELFDAALTSSF